MPGYRPPSTEPRGKWAKRIHEKRRAEGLSQTEAFELLGPRLGLGQKSRAAYVAIDLGKREPTEAEQRVLVDWLGGYPAEDMAGSGQDATSQPELAALTLAVEAQTKMLERVLTALTERAIDPAAVEALTEWAIEQATTRRRLHIVDHEGGSERLVPTP